MQVGVDTGGTFTDVVTADGEIGKVLSTPTDPASAVAAGIDAMAGGRPARLAHGTTVATNALLERKVAVVALVTTEGFADVIEIGRQTRPRLYDHFADRPAPLVGRGHRVEVVERVAPDGTVLTPLVLDGLVERLPPDVESVAVCLLHADRWPEHERAVADALRAAGFDVTVSHELSPEVREFERSSTTVVNAALRPRGGGYLARVGDLADDVAIMTSAAGLVDAATAAAEPARLLLSGPAGGVRAAAAFAAACGFEDAVSFDMGGTSTDVCLIRGGVPEPAPQRDLEGFPVRLPSLDIATIGAGGGSLAAVDAGGALVVGPESAGADPGPACYGRGGERPAVTDANLVAGRIPTDATFGDLGTLDATAAAAALDRAGVTAEGVLAVVNANMERALRTVTVERGVDPRDVALVAFGGAGPLHAADLADALGIPAVIVPPRAGVLSAVGLLCAPDQRDVVRSWPTPLDHEGLAAFAAELAAEAEDLLGGGPDVDATIAFDCRYAGQSHELTVPAVGGFPAEHERRNGYALPGAPVEVIAVRATARRAAPVSPAELPVPAARADVTPVDGPRVIAEPDCTIWVPAGWRADAGAAGCLVLRRDGIAP